MRTDGYLKLLIHFQAVGKKTFTLHELAELKGGNLNAARLAARKLRQEGLIANLAPGFYVIFAPPEIQTQTCSPNDFIQQLMAFKNTNYYVGVLSAAYYYGATHHRPMVFQVVTNRQTMKTKHYNVLNELEFHYKKSYPSIAPLTVKGNFGYINYSPPALTMYDLIKYEKILRRH